MKRGNWKRPLMILAAVAALSALSGCVVVEDDHQGNLTLYWDCEGYRCADYGVDRFFVELYEPGHMLDSHYLVRDVLIAPWDASGTTITELDDGPYDVRIVAVSRTDMVLYEGRNSVDVHARSDNAFTIRLSWVQ